MLKYIVAGVATIMMAVVIYLVYMLHILPRELQLNKYEK